MNEKKYMYGKQIKQQILGNCLIDKNTNLIGSYKNFNINIRLLSSEPNINITINAANPSDLNNIQLNNWLHSNINNFKDIVNFGVNANCVFLIIKRPTFGNNIPDLINYNVDCVINCLISNGYMTGCGNCDDKQQIVDWYKINDNYGCFCNNCIAKIEDNLKQNQVQTTNIKPNLPKGIVGAIGGALLGLIVWEIIYKLGFIAAIGGFAIAFGALFGFEKLGKGLNKNSVTICIVITILTVWLANRVAWSLEAYAGLSNYYSFFECFYNLSELLKVNDLVEAYYGDLFLGFAFTALGSYKMIIQTFRNSTGYYKIEKFEQ